ncbi:MAG: tyrosine-type recombinase/integrase, partial [Phascolarctobacterium sp.]|nr:tyrosine-type recombinase/integrase [Phascolarctobacterium sp.]
LLKHQLTNPEGYVFLKAVTDRVEMPSLGFFNGWSRNFLRKNGIKHVCVHSFRRMAATYALSNKVPLDVVKNMLGHTDIATTNIYLRTLQDSQRDGAVVVSNVYDKLINKEEK